MQASVTVVRHTTWVPQIQVHLISSKCIKFLQRPTLCTVSYDTVPRLPSLQPHRQFSVTSRVMIVPNQWSKFCNVRAFPIKTLKQPAIAHVAWTQCLLGSSSNAGCRWHSVSSVNTWSRQIVANVNIIKSRHFMSSVNSVWSRQVLSGKTCPLANRTLLGFRQASSSSKRSMVYKRRTAFLYIAAVAIFMTGAAYAGVPLYRIFCQATGLGGQAVQGHDADKIESMKKVEDRTITVRFNADVASSMKWNFRPQQTQVKVLPGETALAFYTARNPTDTPIVGISTYNVVPFEAGQYFNKIQCFCFEEQRLNPHEQVDMPVFFYIDPEFAEDPKLEKVTTITLSYTFFEAKEGLQLPMPGYMTS